MKQKPRNRSHDATRSLESPQFKNPAIESEGENQEYQRLRHTILQRGIPRGADTIMLIHINDFEFKNPSDQYRERHTSSVVETIQHINSLKEQLKSIHEEAYNNPTYARLVVLGQESLSITKQIQKSRIRLNNWVKAKKA